MARRVRDRAIETREARRKLKASGKPYWRAIGKGLHVGYRKGKTNGVWVVRRYLGDQNYSMHTIAEADDVLDADGKDVLDFWQAQEAARNLRQRPKLGAYTVEDAVRDYVDRLEGRAPGMTRRSDWRLSCFPLLVTKRFPSLRRMRSDKWHREIAKTPARTRTKTGAEQAYAETICKSLRRNGSDRHQPIAAWGSSRQR